jgi:hypothetical protein
MAEAEHRLGFGSLKPRLVKEALYSTQVAQDHEFRRTRQTAAFSILPEGCVAGDPYKRWEKLPERIERIPDWRAKAFRLLQEVINKP